MKRVVVCGRLSDEQLAELSNDFMVEDFRQVHSLEEKDIRCALASAQGLITASLPITPELLDAMPMLEVIATVSVGYDNYPLEALSRRGILLCNTPDVLTETTADTGFALMLATARRVVELADLVSRGEWKKSIGPEHFGRDVHGKTLGMVGLGRIGAAVARRGALGFGMRILYAQASSKPGLETELGARRCELDRLLEASDFVCVTVPLTSETEHLIGARELALMKPDAILVNIARGQVIDETALIDALKWGRPGAVGLDVYEKEPLPADSPLIGMPNVVALPHIGSATHETRHAMAQRAVDNMRLALKGRRPISPVNIEQLRWAGSEANDEE
ncbi:phosphogluconate 2-dehydrogenase [Modicisalibacter ilicicola DSM 19980]|uniref:Phosphogluconate 2-dehydrogenase n=1 Tax=Modicisalibacter ilicicola DSM 19980 TaxID=1121942 RepID=A0A1M4ZPI6_9GAMM|nr:D-glycerate dehydrogenase [Halomonas ilicicola]SHF19901.1 phosphogluconate 2-dehydrogenase [Halomonas ilicicola DSM 19980]